MIAILVPTHGRPEQCKRMIDSVGATSTQAELHIAVTQGELAPLGVQTIYLVQDMLPTAHKWNMLAQAAMNNSRAKLFMLGADDMVFDSPNWDRALIDAYEALDNKIHCFSLQDSRDIDGHPHPIFTREWIEFWGYMVNPIFMHWKIDIWATGLAKEAGCFTHLRDYRLLHLKPSDEGKPDETFSRIRSWGWREKDQFTWDKCQDYYRFDLQKLKAAL